MNIGNRISSPNNSYALVELHLWQHGDLPDHNSPTLNIATALRTVVKGFTSDPRRVPTPANIQAVNVYLNSLLRGAETMQEHTLNGRIDQVFNILKQGEDTEPAKEMFFSILEDLETFYLNVADYLEVNDKDTPFKKSHHSSEIRSYGAGSFTRPSPRVKKAPKVGRNQPCPCGSGEKFKRCCTR